MLAYKQKMVKKKQSRG